MSYLVANFAIKYDMFNLNENNRIVMAQHPTDTHWWGLKCQYVQKVLGEDANGMFPTVCILFEDYRE